MESLQCIEAFVRTAEAGSFSEAARRLGLTPAGVSKNVAKLEADMGVRLFQRSTRSLALTEAGEQFLANVGGGLAAIQTAIATATAQRQEPAGVLKVSLNVAFARRYLVPMLGDFLNRYPAVVPDWHFDNRQVNLIEEGFDVAIGGALDLQPGLIARELARVHIVAVAAPSYMSGKPLPRTPADLQALDGIAMRSPQTGRLRSWLFRNARGEQSVGELKPRMIMSDVDALVACALNGLGVALIPLLHALPHLDEGTLVRVMPDWHADGGAVAIYFAGNKLLPAKTRAFVDFIVGRFKAEKLAAKFSAD